MSQLAPVAARVVGGGHLRFDFAENFVGVTEINATALAQLFGITGDGADATNLTIVAKHGEVNSHAFIFSHPSRPMLSLSLEASSRFAAYPSEPIFLVFSRYYSRVRYDGLIPGQSVAGSGCWTVLHVYQA